MQSELVETIPVSNTLGECVIWDERDHSLWWTDIQERKLYRLLWENRRLSEFSTPERVASFGLTDIPGTLLVAFETGLALYRPVEASNIVHWIDRFLPINGGVRLNDGRVDRQGRFWVGSMAESDEHRHSGQLYSLDSDGKLKSHLSGIEVTNSICWSPDSRYLYFADSPSCTIQRYRYDSINGRLSEAEIFARTNPDIFPDGSDVDACGNLWNAEWNGGRVSCYDSDGKSIYQLQVPVQQPTCITFGGPNYDLLFVTTARYGLRSEELAAQPEAGNLFVYRVQTQGLPAPLFTAHKQFAALNLEQLND
ncbi:SMP-30/gluconolactonase/LRE family protein [Pseudomaricurvus alkylphenolicus]|uniref:SMP-30/gluconolactonase/LRE family protein n=1 Tax=Pseudomaricurvus alkylphenolicus TaxID=1306991 RepID=UPI00141EDB4A|nr:SMP-30/gluconolactonase/LRE family protein [Pseudomaricurvus alkylphenolicus]NIB38242.1 SMP-30/gluconolactonase/LRE family protein [Pseudomaricurvus alkylphenolicus]